MFEIRIPDLKRYEKEILAYEAKPAETGKIVFYGSSGFTRWKTERWGMRNLEDDIRMKDGSAAAINRGIGGSTAEELLYYYHRVIKPLAPRALVLRIFPNDRAFGYSPAEIVFLISRICAYARADFPGVKLYLCDANPTKRHQGDKVWLRHVEQFNEILKTYCDKHEDTAYVCHRTFPGFFADPADVGDYFKARTDIFVEDGIHFTQEGYDIYRDFFLNALDDIL